MALKRRNQITVPSFRSQGGKAVREDSVYPLQSLSVYSDLPNFLK